MSASFTPEELATLADLVAERVAARLPPHVCAFDKDTQSILRNFAAGVQSAKKTAGATIVGALVLGGISFLGWSILAWIRSKMEAVP